MDLYGFKFQEFKLIQQIEANKCYWKINLLPEKCISTLRFWCCNYFIAWFRVNSLNNQCAIICVDCSTILRMIVLTTISLNFRFFFSFSHRQLKIQQMCSWQLDTHANRVVQFMWKAKAHWPHISWEHHSMINYKRSNNLNSNVNCHSDVKFDFCSLNGNKQTKNVNLFKCIHTIIQNKMHSAECAFFWFSIQLQWSLL